MLIGEVADLLSLSVDTLRYYEKIGLMPRITRNHSGRRAYSKQDVSRLQFIIRAKKMGFSLDEISALLKLREEPQRAKPSVSSLAAKKLTEIDTRISELQTLKSELTLLLNLCSESACGCPILEEMDNAQKD